MKYGVWIDTGCSDFKKARDNRRMVRLKQNIEGYLWIEAIVGNWPHKKPLPEWLCGSIPTVGTHEERDMHEYGIYELDNYGKG